MSGKQRALRERIIRFYQEHNDRPKSFTVSHFTAEGEHAGTIYRVIRTWQKRETVQRKKGSGRPARIMTAEQKRWLRKKFENKDGATQREVARTIGCDQRHVGRTLKKLGIRQFKKTSAPSYTAEQQSLVRRQCRRIRDKFGSRSFVIDDEKYFTLTGTINSRYYATSRANAPQHVRFNPKHKFEPKLMMYLAGSDRGLSRPFFLKSGLAVNAHTYKKRCLKRILKPFLRRYHGDGNYVFWPDKASSQYGKESVDFLKAEGIHFVEKKDNPTNVPQCRPIENFWAILSRLVYARGWKATNLDQLRRRIKQCLRKVNHRVVLRTFARVPRLLLKSYRQGPLSVHS
jgi:transposase